MKPLSAGLVLTMLLPVATSAQTGLGGPVSAVVFDERSGSLRPVNGFPGGAWLGDPIDSPFRIRMAVSSRSGRNAAVVRNDDGTVWIVRNLPAPSTFAPLNLPANPDLLAIDSETRIAAEYSAPARTLRVTTGGDVSSVDLPDYIGTIAAIALQPFSDDVWVGADNGLFLIQRDGSVQTVAPARRVTALLVPSDGQAALFTDRDANEVVAASPGGGIRLLAGKQDGIANPVGLALSSNGKEVWVANLDTQSLIALSIENGTILQRLDATGMLTMCRQLGPGGFIQLSTLDKPPLFVLDQTGSPAIKFVPGQ